MVPIVFAFISPECALPPVEVGALTESAACRFKVRNGYLRYYASIAVGYPLLPVVIREDNADGIATGRHRSFSVRIDR